MMSSLAAHITISILILVLSCFFCLIVAAALPLEEALKFPAGGLIGVSGGIVVIVWFHLKRRGYN